MQARSICFMIMPYGIKPTPEDITSVAPRTVNFDRLWDMAIRPAITDLGYDAVRADQDLGALIIHEMIERLAISDLVVAEMSIPNGNVYYEVGIRHAAKSQGCVLISADWAQPLFDVAQMRQIRYPLPSSEIDSSAALTIQNRLKTNIPPLADGLSPFHTILPGFPDHVDPARASACKNDLQKLSAFQTAVFVVRVSPKVERRELALALSAQYVGRPMQQVVALDLLYLLRDCTDWATTLAFIDNLPAAVRESPVVAEQKALAQSKAGDHLVAIAALLQLIALKGETSERRGLLGGRYKKLYYSTENPGQKATYLNDAIRHYDIGMRLNLNDFFSSSNLPRLYRTRNRRDDDRRAKIAAAVALTACERALEQSVKDVWLTATLLGAAFDSGDVAAAQGFAEDLESERLVDWQLATIMPDLELSLTLQTEQTAAALKDVLAQLKQLVTKVVAAPAASLVHDG